MVTKTQREARVDELIKKAEDVLDLAVQRANASVYIAEVFCKVSDGYRSLAENVKWER